MTLTAGTSMNFVLGRAGTTGGGVNDYINVTSGTATLGGATVNIVPTAGFASTVGASTYTLMSGTLSGSVTMGAEPLSSSYLSYAPSVSGSAITLTVTRGSNIPFVWSGGGGNTNFGNTANWNIGYITPISVDTVAFNSNASVNLDSSYTVSGLSVGSGSIATLGGTGSLTVGSGGVSGAGSLAVGGSLTLNGSVASGFGTVTVNSGGRWAAAGPSTRP